MPYPYILLYYINNDTFCAECVRMMPVVLDI